MTVEEGIKLVISGGIVTPAKLSRRAAGARDARRREVARESEHEKESGRHRLGLVARLRNYFFAGVLVTAPIGITVWLTWEFVSYVDSRVTPFIPPAWNPETYLPFGIPGLGVLLVVSLLTLIGFFAAGLVGRTIVSMSERLLDRMPVIRGVYSAVKQIVETVFQDQSKAFREVVLVQYPRPDSWALGFITGETEGHVQDLTPRQVVNVFLPTTPNPTSGFLLFIPREEITVLSMTVEEGIKMVISGGIVTPPDRRPKRAAASDEPARPGGDDVARIA
ncbi:MAG: DUF502 domain-containing protein [Alphaproteobacteria bacterium]|nr:MAG: DUF502 domain-containing protein [Alphaproteobacteria bacterium]